MIDLKNNKTILIIWWNNSWKEKIKQKIFEEYKDFKYILSEFKWWKEFDKKMNRDNLVEWLSFNPSHNYDEQKKTLIEIKEWKWKIIEWKTIFILEDLNLFLIQSVKEYQENVNLIFDCIEILKEKWVILIVTINDVDWKYFTENLKKEFDLIITWKRNNDKNNEIEYEEWQFLFTEKDWNSQLIKFN